MTFNLNTSNYTLSDAQLALVHQQRAITAAVNKGFVQVAAIYLASNAKAPIKEGWEKDKYLDTDLQLWIDDEALRFHNVGFNLQNGWLDVDIDAADGQDPEFNRCILAGFRHVRIDVRFAFGRQSVGVPTHILIQLPEDEHANFAQLKRFEPKEFRALGHRYHCQLRSYPAGMTDKELMHGAKQTVMPGSVYLHKQHKDKPDISVWWDESGKIAELVRDVAGTTPRRASFRDIVRAIAFGVTLYFIKPHWIEGQRQNMAHKFTGWLTRIVEDSIAINTHEALSTDVYCPVDSDDAAESLIKFLCDECGDDESRMRIRAYHDARDKRARNPDARIPGWRALSNEVGDQAMMALRAVFMPGSDVNLLTQMAERYLYDEEVDQYIDRERFLTGKKYVHHSEALMRRHKNEVIMINDKPKEVFRMFESSKMRKHVGGVDLYPDLTPGEIHRIDHLGRVLSDDDRSATALQIFNTWAGWGVEPIDKVDPAIMAECHRMLDTVLGYLTCDKQPQIDWIKDWLAFTLQFPADKQQIAWVVIGGMGVGKSFIGNTFCQAIFGSLWGSASPQIIDQKFNVGPFLNKMFVFIDEARFNGETATDEVKKLIRNISFNGMEKFSEARNYNIYARMMFAANKFNLNMGQADTYDRALFYTKAYTHDFLNMTDVEFKDWAETLKPFFSEFDLFLKRTDVRQHYMRMFLDRPVNKQAVESTAMSSARDPDIVNNNMSRSRRIARYILEDARILEGLDITTPFTQRELVMRVSEVCKEMGLSALPGHFVYQEYEAAHVVEKIGDKYRFKYNLGTLIEKFGEATGSPLDVPYTFDEADYGANTHTGVKRVLWRGLRKAHQFEVHEGGRKY